MPFRQEMENTKTNRNTTETKVGVGLLPFLTFSMSFKE